MNRDTMSDGPFQATPSDILRQQIMSSLVPKNEREHWAARHIEELERENAANVRAMLNYAARSRAADALAKALEKAIELMQVPQKDQGEKWAEGYDECFETLRKWETAASSGHELLAELAALRARVQELEQAETDKTYFLNRLAGDCIKLRAAGEALATALEQAAGDMIYEAGCILRRPKPKGEDTRALLAEACDEKAGEWRTLLAAWRAPASGKRG